MAPPYPPTPGDMHAEGVMGGRVPGGWVPLPQAPRACPWSRLFASGSSGSGCRYYIESGIAGSPQARRGMPNEYGSWGLLGGGAWEGGAPGIRVIPRDSA